MDELLSDTGVVENEKYRMLYDAVGDMNGAYSFCALPRYTGAADVQSAFEKNMKTVLSNAHDEYVIRVQAGENAVSLMDELENRALNALREQMQ